MTTKIVVAYDGSDSAVRALEYAMDQAIKAGASVVVAHVLEWSPYTFLTPEEIEERHARREDELKRAKTSVIDPALEKYAASGVTVTGTVKYGHVAETLARLATQEKADQLVVGRQGQSTLSKRFFGSVPMTLAQTTPIALTIIP
ncbi:universal stress protein [Poseidonocella sedimentorum]|uniref:Nucleotide-binding universal stress protein, UspA family n=1 Tax=Poseidonocella sedimentorum TaxID=871652 RepID=A0A1I6E5S3_9RHOB|nr:universal stress protein [Poseidonocella sedimentorum]SFR13017.1 Nucleotide-binding universal stress protein, UspA family [Poseidonocella sedimentorum]